MASELRQTPQLTPRGRGAPLVAAAGVVIAGVAAGFAAGSFASHPTNEFALAGLGLLFLPILAWKKPAAAIFVLALISAVLEQYPLDVNGQLRTDWTDQARLYTSLSTTFHLPGVYVFPIELIYAAVIGTLLIRGATRGFPQGTATPMMAGAMALTAAVLIGVIHGQLSHGNFNWALQEARPLLYVVLLYVTTRSLVGGVDVSRLIQWALIIGTGVKSVQTVFRYFTMRHILPRPDSIVSHEDSFFFSLFVALTLLLWVFNVNGHLRTIATWLLPIVLFANLVNKRRTAYVIFAFVIIAVLVMGWVSRPEARRKLTVAAAIGATVGGLYMGAFWNNDGTFGQPARAIRSTFSPSLRDKLSDEYRLLENANLAYNIRLSPIIGRGYGLQIDYVYKIVDLSSIDPAIKYIAHDGVLYLVMRLGVIGASAFWFFLGAAVITAGRLLRSGDRKVMVAGGFVVCTVIAYVLQGYYDLGFTWLRIAVFVGVAAGALDAAVRALPAEVAERHRRVRAWGGATAWHARPSGRPPNGRFRPATLPLVPSRPGTPAPE